MWIILVMSIRMVLNIALSCTYINVRTLKYSFTCTTHTSSTADAQSHQYNNMSTSSALMMVLEGTDAKQHLLIADTLLQLKRNVCTVRNILCRLSLREL